MPDEARVCPYCGDRGMKVLPQGELIVQGRKMAGEACLPCICTLNKYVSDRHSRLAGVGSVSPRDAIEVAKKLPFTNAVIHGPEALFLYAVKCFIVIHFPFNKRFSIVTGADIAEKYAMAQPNGVIPTVDLLTPHDLVAILCVARVNNKAIGPGTQEVIANRVRNRKATWVYAPDGTALLESKEFSPDDSRGSAADLVDGWPTWQLNDLFPALEGYERVGSRATVRPRATASDM